MNSGIPLSAILRTVTEVLLLGNALISVLMLEYLYKYFFSIDIIYEYKKSYLKSQSKNAESLLTFNAFL